MAEFFCERCNMEFETGKPVKIDYIDYVLGPCSRNVAYCPQCSSESREKLVPRPQKTDKPQSYCDGNCRSCSA